MSDKPTQPFYQAYLKEKEIADRTKKYGFPQPWLVEMLVWNFEMLRQLLSISDSFVLKGGAAAQMHLPPDQQRASVDIDLITGLKPKEIDKIFDKLTKLAFVKSVKRHEPKKAKHALPTVTYLIDLPSTTKKEGIQLKVDILFEEIDSYRIALIEDKELFALKTGKGIPCITLGSLTADKLLTLASKSIGIGDERQDELPKHVYDLNHLLSLIKSEDFNDLLFSFERIAKAEMKFRGLNHDLNEVITHVDETLDEFSKANIKGNRAKKLINDFQSAYVSKNAQTNLQAWTINCLRLRYLLKIIKEIMVNKKGAKESFKRFTECEAELTALVKKSAKDRKELRESLLSKAKDKIPYWKQLKGLSEERLFLELKQLE